ncbi:MAG TPA: hypothetical protein VGJ70_02595 [Solirubrobacteraceae bacterium]
MALNGGFDGVDPIRSEKIGRPSGRDEDRTIARSSRLATGTLACPACDAPVAAVGLLSPADPLGCPFCDHAAAVRDFLSLAAPSRPARVDVRVVHRARRVRG